MTRNERILAWDLCNEPFSYLVPQGSLPEIAQTMSVTERTVSRDWNKAKALLAAMVSR